MNFTPKKYGRFDFKGSVDATDPGYNRNGRGIRINDLHLMDGEFECIAYVNYKKTVGIIGIYKDGIVPHPNEFESMGFIGVDSGTAGFLHNKPDYTPDEWDDFCKWTWEKPTIKKGINVWRNEYGFFSTSGHGDGAYDVYAAFDDESGKIIAAEIRFFHFD